MYNIFSTNTKNSKLSKSNIVHRGLAAFLSVGENLFQVFFCYCHIIETFSVNQLNNWVNTLHVLLLKISKKKPVVVQLLKLKRQKK